MKITHGFSLIELLITIAVVGILASVAYPSYSAFITKTNRTEAQRELLRLANVQEQYYVNEGRYAQSMTELGYDEAEYKTASGNYALYVSASNTTSFTLTAEAKKVQRSNDQQCSELSINEIGKKMGFTKGCWK